MGPGFAIRTSEFFATPFPGPYWHSISRRSTSSQSLASRDHGEFAVRHCWRGRNVTSIPLPTSHL